jgi:hypothetical protein
VRSATTATLATVVAVALAWAVVAKAAEPASDLWAKVVGDPTISVAEGTTLDSASRGVPVLSMTTHTWGLPTNTSRLVTALGGPVHVVPTPGAGTDAPVPGTDVMSFFSTPYGRANVLTSGPPIRPVSGSGHVLILDGETGRPVEAPVAVTAAAREALARRIIGAVSWTAGAARDQVDLVVVDTPSTVDGLSRTVSVSLRLRQSCADCRMPWPTDTFGFDAAGHLIIAMVMLDTVDAVTMIPGRSAADAVDAARHHADGVDVGPVMGVLGGPVTLARLVPNYPWPEGPPGATWELYDADHHLVAIVPALPGTSPEPSSRR